MKVFDDVEKDAVYEAFCEYGRVHAKKNGLDENAEDVVLIHELLDGVSRWELVEGLVGKLREMGYRIEKTLTT